MHAFRVAYSAQDLEQVRQVVADRRRELKADFPVRMLGIDSEANVVQVVTAPQHEERARAVLADLGDAVRVNGRRLARRRTDSRSDV